MKKRKLIRTIILMIIISALAYAVYFAWSAFPIISGYAAKNACSCVFIQGREKTDVSKEELASFPLSLASLTVNNQDSSVTARVWGFAPKKAIYRKGLGCTLVNGIAEEEIRSQKFHLPLNAAAPDGTWPGGDSVHSDGLDSYDKEKIREAMDIAFAPKYRGNQTYTRAVVIIKDGKLVAEKYAEGFNSNSQFLGWSMAKSFTGAMIGILVKQGMLDPVLPAPVAQWQDSKDPRRQITLEQLLQQTSGIDFVEDYGSASSVTNMLFNEANMAEYAASLPLAFNPGTVFNYSGGNTNILSGIIRTTVGEKNYHAFPYDSLFHRIGMYHTLLEPDASGNYVGSSYIYSSARDYARFGLLYLNDGVWMGERILPEGWVKKTVTPPAANKLKNYGYQFWLNGLDAETNQKKYPSVPGDMYYASGFGGQGIYIIPSKNLVVVRLGVNPIDANRFLEKVVQSVKPGG